ncbi:endo-1,4-beta-xylanase [Plantactinospora sp. KBS50]|uniref:endo-1,4-beta-xylanase n=1 Tax=Plantactinospora sp. KBS50 TaxID=2024580 RepID=UPI0012FD58B0|nr:endo-1,4-beta-xylanase [Plantactinospora sp. KBS50]
MLFTSVVPGRGGLRRGAITATLLAVVVSVLVGCAHIFPGWNVAGASRHPGAVWQGPAKASWPALRELAPANVRIGSAVDSGLLAADGDYRTAVATDFNAVTPENVMKWANLEPEPRMYNWGPSDKVIEFAQANGQAVYGHTLVWHSSVPSWVSDSLPKDQLRALLKRHVMTVVSRYRGKVWAWDVANEVIAEDGSLRQTLWLRKLGAGYIADVFRWAHEADPDVRLFINDYGAEGRSKKADGLLRLVRQLRVQGVPVHGVGFQSHLRWDAVPLDVTDNLRRFSQLGVSVAITELDVRIKLPATPAKLRQQAMVYQYMLGACLAVSTCESFTVWGFTDASSWIGGHYPGYGAACLFDADLAPKPAQGALAEELRGDRPTP